MTNVYRSMIIHSHWTHVDDSIYSNFLTLLCVFVPNFYMNARNNFTVPQRIDIRNYILGYLANKGPNLENYVAISLIKLVCRITKLGWFDDKTHRELSEDVSMFWQHVGMITLAYITCLYR